MTTELTCSESHDYVADGFWIRVGHNVHHAMYVTVSRTDSSEGNSTWHNAGKRGIAWHHLSTNFGDNKFFRSGWETIVFKDVNNTTRKGFYLQPRGKSYYITFNGWDDIKLEAVRKP